MKVFVCPQSGEMGKFLGVIRAFPEIWSGKVLDVGCRSGLLKKALSDEGCEIEYCGLDIHPPADVIADLAKGLPFDNNSFDVVVALDVLEHIDDIHRAFDEVCRVARKFVVLTLPNVYELRGRIKFLLGLPLSGKYGLPLDSPSDRHRWLFSFVEARRFVQSRAKCLGFTVKAEGCLVGPRRDKILKFLIGRFPNLLSPLYFCVLGRGKQHE